MWNGRIKQRSHKVQGFGLFDLLVPEPACAAYGQMCAWWMRDHEIEAVMQNISHVSLIVWTWPLGGQEITGEGVVTLSKKGITNDARVFARDQNSHGVFLPDRREPLVFVPSRQHQRLTFPFHLVCSFFPYATASLLVVNSPCLRTAGNGGMSRQCACKAPTVPLVAPSFRAVGGQSIRL